MTSVVIWRFIENKIEQNELDLPGGAGGAVRGAERPPNITVGETLQSHLFFMFHVSLFYTFTIK